MQFVDEASASPPVTAGQAAAVPAAAAALQLAQASRALWAATLSLMAAFMQTGAPAHRYLLARRIARNFETLADQCCFDSGSRASFGRLALRWEATCAQFAPARQPASKRSRALLRFLL
ncbi:MAG: hypothetical protein JWP65_1084 [Ramlibacter sp.]|jgi:hypothetical protein|uniref:hypothetical protein n=1 Tax=Ramlibacter sp. TaxID=1917967 RepID=UPI00262C9D16|nr:hypothetical protein [Ramlibacter sp.]MDB5750663.1 hypothetical protein [Ramlibacter sp.]